MADADALIEKADRLWQSDRSEEAKPLLERAIAIFEKAGAKKKLAMALQLQSRVLDDVDDLDGAFQAAARAVDVMEEAVGTDHPDFANMLVNVANFAVLAEDYAEANGLYARAQAIYKASPGTEILEAICCLGMADAFEGLGDIATARNALLRACEFAERKAKLPADDPLVVEIVAAIERLGGRRTH